MMLCSNFLRTLCLCSSLLHVVISVIIDCPRYNFPQDRKEQTNCYRYTPIALLTSKSKVISAPTLFVVVCNEAQINCTVIGDRTGDFVRCVVLQKGSINMTGGPMYKDKYYLNNFVIRFDLVPNNTRVVGTQNDDSTAVSIELVYQNYKYPPSSAYSDNSVRMLFHVEVNGNSPNLEFEKFGTHILKYIRKFNSFAITSAKNVLPWLLRTFLPPYFVYPGSSRNVTSFALVPNTIWMESNFRSHPYISYPQYCEYLLTLRNAVGQPLEGVLSLYPQADRPVREIPNKVEIEYKNKLQCRKFFCG